MTVDVDSAKLNPVFRSAAEQERDILYLIGRGLIDHKERLYECHQTGLTSDVAWPIMETILANIRPYLNISDSTDCGLKLLPVDPSAEMIRSALLASIEFRQRYEAEELQPDSPGPQPAEMIRTVWNAMLQALPGSYADHEAEYIGLPTGPHLVRAEETGWVAANPTGSTSGLRRLADYIAAAARKVSVFPRQRQIFAKQ